MKNDEKLELVLDGIWWLPQKPDEKIGGSLTFSYKDGGILSLFGGLGGIRAFQPKFETNLLHGLTDRGFVTLRSISTKNFKTRIPGIDRQTLGIESIFIGVHLDENDLLFNEVSLSAEYLPEFCNQSGLTESVHLGKKKKWLGLSANVSTQKPIDLGSFDGGNASVKFTWRKTGENLRSVTLEEGCHIKFLFDVSMKIDDILMKYVQPTQNLLTLATDKPNAIINFVLKSKKFVGHKNIPLDIICYQRTIVESSRKEGETLLQRDMIFGLKDLKRNQFDKWLKLSEKFSPTVSILFSQKYSRGLYLEYLLINLVSALEAFHRRKFKNIVLSKQDWKLKKKRILENIKLKSDKDFMNQVLQYSNEKRLKQRITEVINSTGLNEYFILNEKKWNEDVRSYRNILTHYDPDNPKEVDDYELLFWLIQSLSWVLNAALMREFGFTKDEIKKFFCKNERFLFAMRRLERLYER